MIPFHQPPPQPILHFIMKSGCDACAKAKRAVDRVAIAAPQLRLNRIDVENGGKVPSFAPVTYVPSFVLEIGGFHEVWEVEDFKDIPNEKALSDWILRGCQKWVEATR